MAEEWIIVCNCANKTWLLCADRVVCSECKAEHKYGDVMHNAQADAEIGFYVQMGIDMDNTDRVKQMVDVEAL